MTEVEDRFAGRSWETWSEPSIIDIDGVPVAYRRKGSGPTVVFLHAESGTRGWFPFVDELAKDFDVIAPEHPGFGDTPLGVGFNQWADWVLHYEAFFRELGLDNIHLVGDSLGAWLAANLAIYYPSSFTSLTLITPLGLRLKDVQSVDVFRLEDDEANNAYFNGRQDQYADLLSQENELEDYLQASQEMASYALLAWNPRYDVKLETRLQRVTAPTLVVGVDDDRLVSNSMAALYAELIPGAHLEHVHGPEGEPSSHRVTLEQPADVARVVGSHIAENS